MYNRFKKSIINNRNIYKYARKQISSRRLVKTLVKKWRRLIEQETSVHISHTAVSLSQLSHGITISHLWFHEIRRQILITELLLPMRVLSTTFMHVRFLIRLCTRSFSRSHVCALAHTRARERGRVRLHSFSYSLTFSPPVSCLRSFSISRVCTLSLKSYCTCVFFRKSKFNHAWLMIELNEKMRIWIYMNVKLKMWSRCKC